MCIEIPMSCGGMGPPPAPPKEGGALRKADKDGILRPPPAPPKEGGALRKMGKYTTRRSFLAFLFGVRAQFNHTSLLFKGRQRGDGLLQGVMFHTLIVCLY